MAIKMLRRVIIPSKHWFLTATTKSKSKPYYQTPTSPRSPYSRSRSIYRQIRRSLRPVWSRSSSVIKFWSAWERRWLPARHSTSKELTPISLNSNNLKDSKQSKWERCPAKRSSRSLGNYAKKSCRFDSMRSSWKSVANKSEPSSTPWSAADMPPTINSCKIRIPRKCCKPSMIFWTLSPVR